MRQSPSLIVLSGIEPGDTGVGRLVESLQGEVRKRGDGIRVFWRPDFLLESYRLVKSRAFGRALHRAMRFPAACEAFSRGWKLALRDAATPLLLLHPQTLGLGATVDLVRRREGPSTLYLLDSAFFCVTGYNHVAGERGPCTRCLGGRFEAAHEHGCRPSPILNGFDAASLRSLRALVGEGRLRLIAQTPMQAELARLHFDLRMAPPSIGLWTSEFDGLLELPALAVSGMPARAKFDVVFHGNYLPAKGVLWMIEVAALCPRLRFLFPFRPPRSLAAPANCAFIPMRWGSGLAAAVRDSFLTMVPSMWTAPLEGSLVKSLAFAKRVGVVENAMAFASTLPEGMMLRLPREPREAAAALDRAVAQGWRPDEAAVRRWLDAFLATRQQFFENLFSIATAP